MILLQTPLPHVELQSDLSLWTIVAWAALNPMSIAIAYWLGRKADQTPKLGIAAFAGALAGIAVLWIAARFGWSIASNAARGAVGIFVTALPFGVLWAWLGKRSRRTG